MTLSWRKDLKLNDVEQDEGTLVEEGPQIERCTVLHRDANVRFTEEAVVTSGSCVKCVFTWAMSKWRKTVGLSMKRRMKTLSWRKDFKLNDVEECEDALVEEGPQI